MENKKQESNLMTKKGGIMKQARITTLSLTVVSVALLIGSFFCPPMGKIDGSVLAGVGEIFAFAALWFAKDAFFGHDAKATIKHGNTEMTIETDNDDK
jgi:hypothetical protein